MNNTAADYNDIGFLKIPPHSIEAEQAVIGGLLIDPGRLDDVAEYVTADHFFNQAHKIIFRGIEAVAASGKQPDTILVAEHLSAEGLLDQAGGFAAMMSIATNTPSTANITAYASAVRDKAVSRQLIRAGSAISELGFSGDAVEDQIVKAQNEVNGITYEAGDEIPGINAALKRAVDGIDQRYNSDGELIGLSTGFIDIDKRTLGLQPTDFIVVAGRPSMGKTTFALNIVEHITVKQKQACLFFSMEMSAEQLTNKMISSIGNIPFSDIRTGKLKEDAWSKLSSAVQQIKDSPLFIDDRSALDVSQIHRTAKKLAKKVDLKLIVIDYLQLAKAKGADGRINEIGQISGAFKALAKDLKVPVVCLSQLNRDLEKRSATDKRPRSSDLRESGAIEQDADMIAMLYRDEIYNEDTPEKGICEIIWTKYRNGEIGTDRLCSQLERSRFLDLQINRG